MIANFEEKLKKYATLTVTMGIALQKGQEININSPVDCAPFARLLAKTAYEAGAKYVSITWMDEKLKRLTYDYAPIEVLEDIPQWQVEQRNHFVKRGTAVISIAADDPDIYAGADPVKLQAHQKAGSKAFKEYMKAMMSNKNRWCVIAVPTAAWATKVFKNLSEQEAVEKLWQAIFDACRINDGDPVQQWEEHQARLEKRMNFLNESAFDALHFKNSKGTDITVGLVKNHIWASGREEAQDGVGFIANIPTEEVFTTPHKDKINGTVRSSKPLNRNGIFIDDFYFTLKDGKIVDFGAKTGYDALAEILKTDEGILSFGEVALVAANSPISNMNFLFLNTLFDENASCHFALGEAYPSCIKGGNQMTEEELEQNGCNRSLDHIDFMFGTDDMEITGIKSNGETVQLFKNGNWAI